MLLVDDDESTAILVRSLLGKLKPPRYTLEWRGTASEGLAALLGERWDACLLDYHIGDESGFDVLRTALQRNVTTPIIMFTSGAGTDVDLATVRAGAADYLLKTELSPSLLSRTIRYAIERSRLLNEMRSLARHDHLTGLLTRREMDRVLDEELVRSHRYGHPVALILLDLDHFKQVNDTYGHVSGDAALRGSPGWSASAPATPTAPPATAATSWRCCCRRPTTSAPASWPSGSGPRSPPPASSRRRTPRSPPGRFP